MALNVSGPWLPQGSRFFPVGSPRCPDRVAGYLDLTSGHRHPIGPARTGTQLLIGLRTKYEVQARFSPRNIYRSLHL